MGLRQRKQLSALHLFLWLGRRLRVDRGQVLVVELIGAHQAQVL